MLDSLTAYHAEIRAIEDAWFDEHYEARIGEDFRSFLIWSPDWFRLREIQERHDIQPGDPRAYSIASFRAEMMAIRSDWKREEWEHIKKAHADPNVETGYYKERQRQGFRRANCKGRHFPGLDLTQPEKTADTIPKAWHYITFEFKCLELHKFTDLGRAAIDGASKRTAEGVYTILLDLGVPWAPDPTRYPRDFTGRQYRDQLRFYANRLEREEAEALPPELRRAFADGSADCARIERLEFRSDEAATDQPLTEADTGCSKSKLKRPSKEAFEAYRLQKEMGLSQKEIVQQLQKEKRKPFSQSKVSRDIKRVNVWLGQGNELPRPEITAMDPSRLDLGPNRRAK